MKTFMSTFFIVFFSASISGQSIITPINPPWALQEFKTGQSYEIQEYLEDIINIVEPSELFIASSEVRYVECAGHKNGSIQLNVKGGTRDKSVMWTNGKTGDVIDNLSGGVYEALIQDRLGRKMDVYFTVEEPARMEVELVEKVNIDDENEMGAFDVSASGGVLPYSYEWSNGEETEDVQGLDFGQYFLKVTDSNGCEEEFGPFEIENLLAVEDIEFLDEVNLFPNPAADFVNLELSFSRYTKVDVSILNNFGQKLSVSYTHLTLPTILLV